ncbi:MAG TPA: sigma-54 dependent transcriptional regulator [Gemmatimonadaceae bacterium]|nr:sigma-54 dependent transcriptional regulator [Gemmatimonadaceae bacterium]
MPVPSVSPSSRPRILAADDQLDVLEALKLLLKGGANGDGEDAYDVDTARSPNEVLLAVQTGDYDALLIDLNYARDTTSGLEGLDLLQKIPALDATLPVVVMTAWASVDSVVEAMRRGAYDYVEKPWDNARLLATVRNAVALGRAQRRSLKLESENRALRSAPRPELIAESSAMRPILQLMERIAPSDANVLISGEHGTGKDLVANWLHAASPRAGRPFVAVNMGGLSEGVFESELFGHVKGAFTDAKTDRVGRFELADGGTLFLDEIANITLSQQARLLRVLQTGELERVGSSKVRRVDVRVLSATNTNVSNEVAEGRFREDLLFRLNTIEISLPPLRERRDDIPRLAHVFLRRHAERYRKAISGFDAGGAQALLDYSWPGNVRELGHAIERGVLLAQGDQIRAADLGLRGGASSTAPRLDDLTLADAEQLLIRRALARFDGNVSLAAKHLGVSRSALYRRLDERDA